MKKIIFFLFFTIISFSISSQPIVEWEKKIDVSRRDNLIDFILLADGSFIGVGISLTEEVQPSYYYRYYKFDCHGNIIWQRRLSNYIDGANSSNLLQILAVNQKTFVISGSYTKIDGNNYRRVGFISLVDSSGEISRTKEIDASKYLNIRKTILDGEQNLIVLLDTPSADGIFQGNKGDKDIWILKLDMQLNILYTKNIGGDGGDEAGSIIKTKNRGYIITGGSFSKNGDIKTPYAYQGFPSSGGSDAFVIKLTESLDIEWSYAFGGNQNDNAYSAIEMPNGNIVVGGTTGSYDGAFFGRNTAFATDSYVANISGSGSFISAKYIANDRSSDVGAVSLSQILAIDTSNYLVVCRGRTTNGLFNTPNPMTWLLKMNTKNEIVWKKNFGLEKKYVGAFSEGYQIKQTIDKGYIMVGAIHDTAVFRTNLWIVKMSSLSTDKPFTCTGLSLYPNPTIGSLKIQSSEYLKGDTEIKVYDVIGRNVYQGVTGKSCKDTDIKLPDNLISGLYYLTISETKCVLPFVKVN